MRAAVIALVAFGLASPAQAGTWSPPGMPAECPVAFGFSPAGRGVALLGSGWTRLSRDGTYGAVHKLPFEPTALAFFGRDRFGAVGYLGRAGTQRPPFHEYVLLGHSHELTRTRYSVPAGLGLTVSAKGRAVVLFGGTRIVHRKRLTEVLLASNGFKRTTVVARGRNIGDAVLAGNARGDAIVAWRRGLSIYARLRTPGGRLLKAQRLGVAKNLTTISAAVAAGGQALVSWTTAQVENNMLSGPETVATAFRRAGARFAQ